LDKRRSYSTSVIPTHIRQYSDMGWTVLPAPVGEKSPFSILPRWKPYQKQTPLEAELETWFAVPRNVLVVLGKAPTNLADIEFDIQERAKEFNTHRTIGPTAAYMSYRGPHSLYRTPTPISTFKIPDCLEVRGVGSLSVLPTSLGKTGFRYQWLTDRREPLLVDDLPDRGYARAKELGWRFNRPEARPTTYVSPHVRPARSLSLFEREKIVNAMVSVWRPGKRNELTLSLLGLFLKRNIPESDAREVLLEICQRAGDEEKSIRLREVRRHYRMPPSQIPRLRGLRGLWETLG